MKFFIIPIAAAIFGFASADIHFTNNVYDPVAGQQFTLTWAENKGPVTILLKTGPAKDLKDVKGNPIGTNLNGESWSWTPTGQQLVRGQYYAFEILDGSDNNYSPAFQVGDATGTEEASTTSTTTKHEPTTTAMSKNHDKSKNTDDSSSTTTETSTATASGTKTGDSSASTTMATQTSAAASASSSANTADTPSTNGAGQFAAPLAPLLFLVAGIAAL